jgi:hypothetical protein
MSEKEGVKSGFPKVENVVMDMHEGSPEMVAENPLMGRFWAVGNEVLGPDFTLSTILNHFGGQGYKIAAAGGILADGSGPTRLILERFLIDVRTEEPAKSKSPFIGGD